MTHPRSFEEVMAERLKTLEDIQATIKRINDLIEIISEQIRLEQQWQNASPDSPPHRVRQDNRSNP